MTATQIIAQMIALIGPTASGKSAVALALAERIGGEILSVDSMQVYRGMNIGTAKPNAIEQREIKHHLIDVCEPSEQFTVAMFVERADAAIREARKRGMPLIVTGGTPLYFKALFEGLFAGPGADPEVRARLTNETTAALHARLASIDPPAAARVHANDRKRLVRAIEVFELTGRPISSMQTEWQSPQPRYAARWFGLSWPRDALNRRINARVKKMIDDGWLDETRQLLARYGQLSQTAAEATGYAELIEHLQGRLSLGEAIERIKIATRQLARRQMKWFRRFPNVDWLEGAREVETIAEEIVSAV